ncbi:MAG: hypothetical protein JOS17DRAFT_479406 [Linnemannia elongata]|nr:MAG: hypothetical protein JOS17DRAFT_479406 [Linnemannia elongata]
MLSPGCLFPVATALSCSNIHISRPKDRQIDIDANSSSRTNKHKNKQQQRTGTATSIRVCLYILLPLLLSPFHLTPWLLKIARCSSFLLISVISSPSLLKLAGKWRISYHSPRQPSHSILSPTLFPTFSFLFSFLFSFSLSFILVHSYTLKQLSFTSHTYTHLLTPTTSHDF